MTPDETRGGFANPPSNPRGAARRQALLESPNARDFRGAAGGEPRTEYRRIELRRVAGTRQVEGIVVRYSDEANIAGVFRERIKAGSLKVENVTMNIQHERALIVARQGVGLELIDGPAEMRLTAELAKTRVADDALEALDARLYQGLSVGMVVEADNWTDEGELPLRTIDAAIVREVSLVDTPAYPQSLISESRAILDTIEGFGRNPVCRRRRVHW